MKTKKISQFDTIILDFGGILFSPQWRVAGIKKTAEILGINDTKFKTLIKKYQSKFYTGELSENDFWINILNDLDIKDTKLINVLEREYRKYVTPIEANFQIITKLKNNFKLISYNNTSKEWMDYRIEKFNLKKYFNTFITSGFTGYLKPSIKSLQILKQNCDFTKSLYIDDNSDYIETAKKNGFHTKLYEPSIDLYTLLHS